MKPTEEWALGIAALPTLSCVQHVQRIGAIVEAIRQEQREECAKAFKNAAMRFVENKHYAAILKAAHDSWFEHTKPWIQEQVNNAYKQGLAKGYDDAMKVQKRIVGGYEGMYIEQESERKKVIEIGKSWQGE